MRITFGNQNKNYEKMELNTEGKVKFLVNIGHMDDSLPLDDEKKKVQIAFQNDFDIIADNSISSSAYSFRKWISDNYPVKVNSVPVYQCFDKMQNGSFEFEHLKESIYSHIDSGVDMLVVHPGLTRSLAMDVLHSNRIIPVTSRGGAQLYSYMMKYHVENPYFEHWDEIISMLKGTGVCLALGLTLRAGSILDELDELYLKEMDMCGLLINKALSNNIPVVIEGIGHVRLRSISTLISEVNKRCLGVPIKTLGPIGSDRICGLDNINALITSSVAAMSGVSIIGALLKSEHVGLPNIEDYNRDLRYFKILKYLLNLDDSNEEALFLERNISIERRERCWQKMFQSALFPEEAETTFMEHNNSLSDKCTMCGKMCAHKLVLGV